VLDLGLSQSKKRIKWGQVNNTIQMANEDPKKPKARCPLKSSYRHAERRTKEKTQKSVNFAEFPNALRGGNNV
jgi:hypothetical protein